MILMFYEEYDGVILLAIGFVIMCIGLAKFLNMMIG